MIWDETIAFLILIPLAGEPHADLAGDALPEREECRVELGVHLPLRVRRVHRPKLSCRRDDEVIPSSRRQESFRDCWERALAPIRQKMNDFLNSDFHRYDKVILAGI